MRHNFNIVPMENVGNGFRPILCVCICITIDSIQNLTPTLTHTQTLRVNKPLMELIPLLLRLAKGAVCVVANPGFPRGGGANPKGGHQPIIWPIFPENCMKMKKFWARGGRHPLDPPLNTIL